MSPRSFLRLLWLEIKYELLHPCLIDPCVVLCAMARDAFRRRKTANH